MYKPIRKLNHGETLQVRVAIKRITEAVLAKESAENVLEKVVSDLSGRLEDGARLCERFASFQPDHDPECVLFHLQRVLVGGGEEVKEDEAKNHHEDKEL